MRFQREIQIGIIFKKISCPVFDLGRNSDLRSHSKTNTDYHRGKLKLHLVGKQQAEHAYATSQAYTKNLAG